MARYWVGGTGSWDASTTTHWSDSSGGAGGSSVPTSSDDVIFDAGSASDNYTVTITATANCANFTMDKPTGVGKKVTLAGSSTLNIYGNLNLIGGTAGITWNYGAIIYFKATTGTKTIATNSIEIYSFWFNGLGAIFQLTQDLIIKGSYLYFQAGTFDANSRTVIIKTMASTCHLITSVEPNFYNLTYEPGNFNDNILEIKGNFTVTNTFTITGYSAIKRVFIKSDTLGTARTITTTGGSVAITNCDFQDITATGDAGDWDLSAIAGGSGDCGGNTGITFTTADDWYWHSDTGNVSDYTKWYTQTNGGGTQMASTLVPLPQDTLHFDDSSFTTGSQTITQNMPRIGGITFAGATNTPEFTTSTSCISFGSITLISGMTLTASTQELQFQGRGSYTLDCGGKTWAKTGIYLNAPGGTLTLKSDFLQTQNRTFYLLAGTLSAVDGLNNYNFTTGYFTNNSSITRTLTMGSGLWTLGGVTGNVWYNNATNYTVTANTATIKLVGALTGDITFDGAGKSFNNIWNATTNNYALIIASSNTFNDFKIDAGRTVKFTNSTTTTVNTFTALGTSGSHITLSNTSSTTHATLTKAGGGIISGCDYIDSSYLTGSPDLTWYMGANSTNTNCTNMYTVAPTTNTTDFFNYI